MLLVLVGTVCCNNREVGEVNRIVNAESCYIAVIAVHDQDIDSAVLLIGISIKVIHRVIFRRFCNVCGSGKADGTTVFVKANCVQLVLAGISCFLTVLFLRPDDGQIIQIIAAGRCRKAEIGGNG